MVPSSRRVRFVRRWIPGVAAAALLALVLLLVPRTSGRHAPSDSPQPACASSIATSCSFTLGPTGRAVAPPLPVGRSHLVEFVSEHCPACSRIAPLVSEIEQRCTNGDGSIVRLDLESDRGRALAEHFGVNALPTFLHLDAEGHEVDRAIGALNREQLASVVEIVHGSDCAPL